MNRASSTRGLHEAARGPWWLLFALVCHGAFSWIGFNPTDEGWLQAVARRLVDGEVPHRDFIFVRPALSALLQVPLLLWGDDQVLWLARLWGWVTLAATSWLWSGLVGAAGWTRPALAWGALLIGAHTFPVMAWHTLDGLLLASGGIWFARAGRLAPAFLLVGCAGLCRQNFGLLAPLLALSCGLSWRGWLAAGGWSLLPLGFYTAALATVGGAGDFLAQIVSVRNAFTATALGAWGRESAVGWGLVAGVAAAWSQGREPRLGAPIFFAACAGLVAALTAGIPMLHRACFALTAFVAAGAALGRERSLGLAGLGLVWVTSISAGYNQPTLAAGVLICLLWRFTHPPSARRDRTTPSWAVAALAGLVLTVGVALARWRWPYCDLPASRLHWEAGDALPGARGLRTNPFTTATLAELLLLADESRKAGRGYLVLTDCAAYWVRSPERNPLPVEWAQETELGDDPRLQTRVLSALEALPPGTRAIVQKYFIAGYAWRLQPLRERAEETGRYAIQGHVERTWRQVGESRFFLVYERPAKPAS